MNSIIPLLGRIGLGLIFIMAGISKIKDPTGTQAYMASQGMPAIQILMIAAIIAELGGGLSLILGYLTRWGAAILVLFLIPTTIIFHTNFADQMQMILFLKNLAIMGGLLMVVAHGPGSASIDSWHRN